MQFVQDTSWQQSRARPHDICPDDVLKNGTDISASGGADVLFLGMHQEKQAWFRTPEATPWMANPLPIRERMMISMMSNIKDKADWHIKVFNDEIVSKWREEALAVRHEDAKTSEEDSNTVDGLEITGEARQKQISQRMFDYCIAELRDHVEPFKSRGYTEAIDASACVYISDTAVPIDIKQTLRKNVEKLEDVDEAAKDWHPGSDGKVLDIVHPSLYPVVYGRSRILVPQKVDLMTCTQYCGKGVTFPSNDKPYQLPKTYSDRFQWLPCEVQFDDNDKAKIVSYINNLHPFGHESLYQAIEGVITAAKPMWLDAILSAQTKPVSRIEGVEKDGFAGDGWVDRTFYIDEKTGEKVWDLDRTGFSRYDSSGSGDEFDYDEADDDQLRERLEKKKTKAAAIPEPVEYSGRQRKFHHDWRISKQQRVPSKEAEGARLQRVIKECGLQVIVKLANIVLTPDKPNFDGGSWHVEGMGNEQIVASALYYYDNHNVTESTLAFRECVNSEFFESYGQDDWHALSQIFGAGQDEKAVQAIGSVVTKEDRLLVFPNVLQHRVAPFRLEDPTKCGHRKLLALFLVNPYVRIPSTMHVPPQQREWWMKDARVYEGLAQKFPAELTEWIVDDVESLKGDGLMTLAEAKQIREEFITERKPAVNQWGSSEDTYEQTWSFCEH